MTFLSWNVNGWYRDTKAIKSQIICGIGPDFVAISETHLKDSEEIEIPGYLCITNSRRLRNVRARRNSGGVCLLFKDCILNKYKYEIIDKCYDGILAIKFTRTQDMYNFVIICLYLPPEQTSWGRNASAFYAHVMQIIYENSYCDDIILAGDLNSKIGDMPDYVMEVDSDVHPRKALDKTINRHGKELVEFLIQSKFVACNGRITPENDNFTFVHSRGKSIIDYIMVPIDSIQKCLKFCVCPPRDLVNKYCDIRDSDINLSKMIPDHSALILTFNTHIQQENEHVNCDTNQTFQNQPCHVMQENDIYHTRFNVRQIPGSFLNNEIAEKCI